MMFLMTFLYDSLIKPISKAKSAILYDYGVTKFVELIFTVKVLTFIRKVK